MADKGTIPLQSLKTEELQHILQRTERDMDGLSQSAQALTAIAERYTAGNNALNALKTGKAFVPLTASLYVEGEIVDAQNVLVDVGAKYYIVMSKEEAIKYSQRRVAQVDANVCKIEEAFQQKQRLREGIAVTLQQRAAGGVPQ